MAIKFGQLLFLIITVAYSHYWPPYGGVNGGSRVATGELAVEWQNTGIACPLEYEFGTKLLFADRVWTCVDRGSLIRHTSAGLPIIDFMEQHARYGHKTPIEVGILLHEFPPGVSVNIPY